jgi:hypothetical protein
MEAKHLQQEKRRIDVKLCMGKDTYASKRKIRAGVFALRGRVLLLLLPGQRVKGQGTEGVRGGYKGRHEHAGGRGHAVLGLFVALQVVVVVEGSITALVLTFERLVGVFRWTPRSSVIDIPHLQQQVESANPSDSIQFRERF